MLLATGDVSGAACLWNPSDATLLKKMSCGSPVRGLDLSQDALRMATGNAKGDAVVWSTQTGMALRTVRCGGMVYSVHLAGNYLATGSQDKKARVAPLH